MASHSAVTAVHATLTAATVDDVTLSAFTGHFVIINRGTDPISYLFGAAPGDPTELGDDTLVVPASAAVTHDWVAGVDLVVKLISAGTPAYSVQAV